MSGSLTVPVELCGGPYAGRVGELTFSSEPQQTLAFSLADKDDTSGLFITKHMNDDLTAVYVIIREKPRKVQRHMADGSVRSDKGLRYRYDADLSPCERILQLADEKALLTKEAAEQVHNTRQLLLDEAKRKRAS